MKNVKYTAWNKGLTKESDERVAKYAKSLIGKCNSGRGEKHWAWKGENCGYTPLHLWIRRELGNANHCENDPTHISKKYEWSNIDGKYRRTLNDYRQLCCSCHRKYDNKMNGYVAWNKGKKLGFIPKMAFKKGQIPWNKGLHHSEETKLKISLSKRGLTV